MTFSHKSQFQREQEYKQILQQQIQEKRRQKEAEKQREKEEEMEYELQFEKGKTQRGGLFLGSYQESSSESNNRNQQNHQKNELLATENVLTREQKKGFELSLSPQRGFDSPMKQVPPFDNREETMTPSSPQPHRNISDDSSSPMYQQLNTLYQNLLDEQRQVREQLHTTVTELQSLKQEVIKKDQNDQQSRKESKTSARPNSTLEGHKNNMAVVSHRRRFSAPADPSLGSLPSLEHTASRPLRIQKAADPQKEKKTRTAFGSSSDRFGIVKKKIPDPPVARTSKDFARTSFPVGAAAASCQEPASRSRLRRNPSKAFSDISDSAASTGKLGTTRQPRLFKGQAEDSCANTWPPENHMEPSCSPKGNEDGELQGQSCFFYNRSGAVSSTTDMNEAERITPDELDKLMSGA